MRTVCKNYNLQRGIDPSADCYLSVNMTFGIAYVVRTYFTSVKSALIG